MSDFNNGLKVTVAWDTVDEIMEQNLIQTYNGLVDDVKRLRKHKKLPDYAKEDLEQFKKLLEALDVVGAYFVYDFKKKVKKK